MRIETHCHSYLSSDCADTPNEIIIEKYIKAGYDGVVITNHLSSKVYTDSLRGETFPEKMDHFFELMDDFKVKCEKSGLKFFWGSEIRVIYPQDKGGTEFTVLGLPKEVYYSEPPLFVYTQRDLFNLVEKYGAFLYQTHPFRKGVVQGKPEFMHGAERFNGHYHHPNNNDLAEKFCKENNLVGLSGSDMHHLDQPVTAGIIIDEDIEGNDALVKKLFKGEFEIIKTELV